MSGKTIVQVYYTPTMTDLVKRRETMRGVEMDFIAIPSRVNNGLSYDILKLYLAPILRSQSAYLARACHQIWLIVKIAPYVAYV